MRRFLALTLLAGYAAAQTETVADELGQTVVEVITVNVDGQVATQTIATVTPGAPNPLAATDPNAVPTTDPNAVPPAVPPAATTPQTEAVTAVVPTGDPNGTPTGPFVTTYTHTSTDWAAGTAVTSVVVWSPSQPAASPSPTLSTGTVLDYTAWLTQVGTFTQPANAPTAAAAQAVAANSASGRWKLPSAMLVSVVVGGLAVLGRL